MCGAHTDTHTHVKAVYETNVVFHWFQVDPTFASSNELESNIVSSFRFNKHNKKKNNFTSEF